MEKLTIVFIENWVSVTGMFIVNLGLLISILGAVKIYRADSPRNDWILDAAYAIAERPTYGVIAPSGYSPKAEKHEARSKAKELADNISKYNKTNKNGMGLIFIGFIIQFIGNMLWGLLYLYT